MGRQHRGGQGWQSVCASFVVYSLAFALHAGGALLAILGESVWFYGAGFAGAWALVYLILPYVLRRLDVGDR